MISEYIIKGNAAIIKCNIPSFVTDFARVEAWLGSDGQEYKYDEKDYEYGKGLVALRHLTSSILFMFDLLNIKFNIDSLQSSINTTIPD